MDSSRSRKRRKGVQEVEFVPVKNKRTGKRKVKEVPVFSKSPSPKKRKISKMATASTSKNRPASLSEAVDLPSLVGNQFSIENIISDYGGSDWGQSRSPPKAAVPHKVTPCILHIIHLIFHLRLGQRQLQMTS
jgi:hypothetical protein